MHIFVNDNAIDISKKWKQNMVQKEKEELE